MSLCVCVCVESVDEIKKRQGDETNKGEKKEKSSEKCKRKLT